MGSFKSRPETTKFVIDNLDADFVFDQLKGASGFFIATEERLELHDPVAVSIRVSRRKTLEVPCVVVGRRHPKGASGRLASGVVVRAIQPPRENEEEQ